jgi:hypothetical protein
MFDWYSEYVMARARQAELVGAAELRRRLGEVAAATRARPGREKRRAGARRRQSLRYRVGAALILLGRLLQGAAPGLPEPLTPACGK